MATSDFKFGAKIKLFGEHEIIIRPNRENPLRVEYHDQNGIGVTKELLTRKLKITNKDIQNIIPNQTKITDLVYDRASQEFEIGIVVNPGKEFVLNRYKDILEIEEVSMFYKYDPSDDGGENEETDIADDFEDAVDEVKDAVNDVVDDLEENLDDVLPDEDDFEENPDDVLPNEEDMMEEEEEDLPE